MKSWYVGDKFCQVRTIGWDELALFCALVGDENPIHTDPDAAEAAGFERPIAHGMIAGSMFSEILGTHLPGPGSIYVQQQFRFVAPIYVGTEVRISVEVIAVREDQKVITVRTTCSGADGTLFTDGEAILLRRNVSGVSHDGR